MINSNVSIELNKLQYTAGTLSCEEKFFIQFLRTSL